MRHFKFVYNPLAGSGKILKKLPRILELFAEAGCSLSVFRIGDGNLAAFLRENAAAYEGLIVAGGDGTINQVINCMFKNGVELPLAILCSGTANSFAKHIKLPRDLYRCVERIVTAKPVPVDLGRVNDKYFINVCSAGAFTNVSQKVDKKLKNAIGNLSYVVAGVREAIFQKPIRLRITCDGRVEEANALLFLVFNGSGIDWLEHFAPTASVTDGLLDLVVIRPRNVFSEIRVFAKLLAGRHFGDRDVTHLQGREIRIELLEGECSTTDIDGEPAPLFPLDIRCLNKRIMMYM